MLAQSWVRRADRLEGGTRGISLAAIEIGLERIAVAVGVEADARRPKATSSSITVEAAILRTGHQT